MRMCWGGCAGVDALGVDADIDAAPTEKESNNVRKRADELPRTLMKHSLIWALSDLDYFALGGTSI